MRGECGAPVCGIVQEHRCRVFLGNEQWGRGTFHGVDIGI
jgi:hypothetical protein